mmetsp:Transcript_165618/g.531608  ORF Transcript_165618/g.531608 Transcript_165618/m.531608 type:complete len:460 (+) Transcript_165618:128-1507(+)
MAQSAAVALQAMPRRAWLVTQASIRRAPCSLQIAASSNSRLSTLSRGSCRGVHRHARAHLCGLSVSRRAFATETDAPTTDATFRYRRLNWVTSCGESYDYEYLVAQQPAGGATARNARSAIEEELPRPVSGWSIVLLPSVSLICSGKEEMRPLAAMLSQRGHRCYILEWPGWTADSQVNFSLVRCKVEDLYAEYVDFWCQLLQQIAEAEVAETAKADGSSAAALARPRLCIVGASQSSIYALRALQALRAWKGGADAARSAAAVAHFESMVMVAPSWRTKRSGLFSLLPPPRVSRWFGLTLHSETRMARWVQSFHFGAMRFRAHFVHRGANDGGRLKAVASWLFQRPRPFVQTDAAVLGGLLDPAGTSECAGELSTGALADEVAQAASALKHGVLVIAPQGGSRQSPAQELTAALRSRAGGCKGVECNTVESDSPLPHEVAISNVYFLVEQWLGRKRDS